MDVDVKSINKQIAKVQLTYFPGPLFLGVGLFGFFGRETSPDSIVGIFQAPLLATSLVVVGAAISWAEYVKLRPLWDKKKALEK